MAHAKRLSPEAASRLISHLGDLLSQPHVGVASNVHPQLGESFEIFELDPSHIPAAASSGVGIETLLRKSSLWHHQIVLSDGTYRFARSREPHTTKEQWQVQGVFSSPLAQAVADAVKRIDRERPGADIETRLIFAPAYHLHAFLLKGPERSEVFVIDGDFAPQLEAGRFYSERDFLTRLKSVPVRKGIVADDSARRTKSASAPPNDHAFQIIPSAVELGPTNRQQFSIIGNSGATRQVSWLVSPGVGTINTEGLYTPDPSVTEITHVKVTAISEHRDGTATASVTLLPRAIASWKRNALGVYLLAVFSLVFVLIELWPPSPPDPVLSAAKQEAQKTLEADAKNIASLQDALSRVPSGKSSDDALTKQIVQAKQKQEDDSKALEKATNDERATTESRGETDKSSGRLGANLPKEIDFLYLVLIAGALGAFLHSVRSFTTFVGNASLRATWMWWYYLHPFLGAILALTFYFTLRGGFVVIASGAVKTSDLSPFAIVSGAVLAGMFSKAATTKLGEIFNVIFQANNPSNAQNPVQATPQPGPANPALRVTAVSPNSGSASGGTHLTISGTGFVNGAKVIMGGFPATSVTWVSATLITAVSPQHAAGTVNVEVANPDMQKGILPGAFRFV